ncbi:hypothetical protein V6S02_13695 [Microbacterium sp. CCNWLW134]|uniref:hypothetical protein n=1 Tax=Microbacterium sp. CCNWLW134 TaxID=3122064 RepID=UPI0030100F89
MRIVVSGTHAAGKSTLISDFVERHPAFVVFSDPFDLIDERWDGPHPAAFAAQLRIAADRLRHPEAADLIAERGPLDFLAYLWALDRMDVADVAPELLDRARAITAEAMHHVDLIVVLPLAADDVDGPAPDEDGEYAELREMMNDILLDLVDDEDLVGPRARTVEIGGAREARLAALTDAVDRFGR